MKKYKFLQSAMLVTLITTVGQANDNGFYVGANAAFITLGDDSMNVEHKGKTQTTYHKISSLNYGVKIGYQHFEGNRVELYFRQNNLDSKEGDISTQTMGINYEWAFSSFASENLLPYTSVGVGFGKASSSDLKDIDDVGVGEVTFGLGAHYQYAENVDFQVGYQYIKTGFTGSDDKKIANDPEIGQNNIIVGMNYKF